MPAKKTIQAAQIAPTTATSDAVPDDVLNQSINGLDSAPNVSDEPSNTALQQSLAPRFRIASRNKIGFWRCGRQWHSDGGVPLTLAEIGGAEVLAVLRAEPMLTVQEVNE